MVVLYARTLIFPTSILLPILCQLLWECCPFCKLSFNEYCKMIYLIPFYWKPTGIIEPFMSYTHYNCNSYMSIGSTSRFVREVTFFPRLCEILSNFLLIRLFVHPSSHETLVERLNVVNSLLINLGKGLLKI